jgi:hypothetical protein
VEITDVVDLRQREELLPREAEGIVDESPDLELPGVEGDVRHLAEVEDGPVLDLMLTDRPKLHLNKILDVSIRIIANSPPDMKALVLNALEHGFDLEGVEIAAPRGREVLVDVQASGLCHTDLLFATHDIAPTPSVLGHEVAGIVAAIGPDVTHARLGDHVVGALAQACGACARCLSGRPFQCQHPESTPRRPDEPPRLSRNGLGLFQGFALGGFAEQALIHENQLAVVPKEMPFAQAALLGCSVVTGASTPPFSGPTSSARAAWLHKYGPGAS